MKTLEELPLSKKTKIIVEIWLKDWLKMLIKNADGREGTVYRADFEKNDFFYFTNCNDILLNDPEARGQEHNRKIQIRKRTIMAQLLIKNLLGGEYVEWKKNKCSHCGYHNRYIDSLPDGNGHFLFCPNCLYTTIGTYPNGYDTCISGVRSKLHGKFIGDIGTAKQISDALQQTIKGRNLDTSKILKSWKEEDEKYTADLKQNLKKIVKPSKEAKKMMKKHGIK